MAALDLPLFQVITAAAAGDTLRLATLADLLAEWDDDDEPGDSEITDEIDAASASMASAANLAVASAPATFGLEVLRATWFARTEGYRGEYLLLPWRPPISSVSVVEAGVTLTENTHFIVHARTCMLQRLTGDSPTCWSTSKIVVNYSGGFLLPTNAPDELRKACILQAKYQLQRHDKDLGLRSFTTPDVEAASYNVAGGETISTSGLLREVESALEPYTKKSI